MKHLKPLLTELQAPRFAGKRKIHDQLAPIMEAVADVQMQLVQYRRLADAAHLADEDPGAEGKIEHFRQTFGALEREVAALSEAARNVARGIAQLDRYAEDLERVIDESEAAKK